ncbi:MAG: PD-(D/E)XK nuclease family protein [Clostridia bacterium]|nr:PD-(D/E)XK nuclease family protein [Clostridia bacterium]
MVRFIFGGTGSGKSEYVFGEIEKLLRESDKKIYLIVPEPFTVATEAKIARRFPPSAALRLEGTNFTRLADSVSRVVGGLSYSRLTKGARMLLLWRSMMSVWPSLTELNQVSDGDGVGIIPTVFAAERELKLSGITPDVLYTAAESLDLAGENSLSRRTRDLAVICAAMSMAEEEFGDTYEPVKKLAENVKPSGYFDGAVVFIDSFYSLTGAQSAVLSRIVRCAADVYITVPMESRRAEGVHLDGVKRFYSDALSAALRYSPDEVEFVTLEGNRRAGSAELETVQAHLWDYGFTDGISCSELPSVPESVRVFSVADRYAEAEAVCSEIARLVRGGADYSDIVVACADVSEIRGICDSALRRHGIPCFISETSKISASPAVRLILSLLKIPGRWRREDIISVVKTGLSPLDDGPACSFESYTDIWNIRGRNLFTTEWSMNPDGYTEEISERAALVLAEANDARDALIPGIEKFADTFVKGKATVTDVCRALTEYFAEGAYAKMMARADMMERDGAADDAARERLVWREICSAFDTMAEMIGDVEVDAQGFASLFRYAVSDADTGAIPTGVDVVTVSGAAGLRTDGVKHVIVLGAVAGEFPASVSDDGYFTDDDKRRLESAGVVLGADSGERTSEELFRFFRTVSQAAQTLTVFVPKTSASAPVKISEGAERILTLLGRTSPTEYDFEIYDAATLDAACRETGDEALVSLRRELFGEAEEIRFTPSAEAEVSAATAAEVFGDHVRLSQSRIDSYVKCPMSYYCDYVLKLSEDRRAEISAPDIGSFVHAVLEELLKHITVGGDAPEGEALQQLCDEIIASYIKKTCPGISGGRLDYLFKRLRRQVTVFAEAIVREVAQSRFETYAVELPVGAGTSGEASPPAVIFPLEGGGEVSLVGRIDRLDTYSVDGKTYIRVIDYKTGSTKFSYDDVALGLNVQLLIYLFSAWRAADTRFHRALDGDGKSELLPAGALYFNLRPADNTSDRPLSAEEAREITLNSMDRSGIVSDERDVLDAMDRGITGRYVPVSLKADGNYKKSASLATLERFGELYREMESVICRIAAEMKSGKAGAVPLEHHGSVKCDWCAMRHVCRRENK